MKNEYLPNLHLAKENNIIILGIILILSYYFLNIFSFFTESNNNLYLSLSILTDNSYLNLLLNDKSPIFQDGLSFFPLTFFIDRLFIKIFGIEYFWSLMIFYKLLCFLVLFKGFQGLFNFTSQNSLLIAICLAFFLCIDIAPFADRYPRPQLTNIFVFVVILSNLFFLDQNKGSRKLYIFYGMSQAIIVFSIPWMAAIILFLSVISFFYKTDYILKKYSIIGFSIIFFPALLFFFINSINSSHSEYLGLKEIYSKTDFLIDFYVSILFSKQFLLLLFFQASICLIIKRLLAIQILFGSILFSPLIFILFGKSIQAYHLIEGFKEYQIILCIWTFFSLFYYFQEKQNSFSKLNKYIGISVILMSLLIILNLGSSWIDRAKEIKKLWIENEKTFSYLDAKSSECILITNDKDIFFYWLNFNEGMVLPKDGFLNTAPINETLKNIKLSLAFISEIEKPKINDINQILKLATHNYYVSTRSTIAKSLRFENDTEEKRYIKSREGVNSMQAWRFVPNDMAYKDLATYDEISLTKKLKKDKIIFYRDLENRNIFKINDYCIN